MSVDVAAVRARLADPVAVCGRLGIAVAKRQPGGGVIVRCPTPGHTDKHPSCSVTTGPDGTLRWRCFSCGASGDVLTLLAAVEGRDVRSDFADLVRLAADLAGVLLDDQPKERMAAGGKGVEKIPHPGRARDEAAKADPFAAIVAPLLHLGRLDGSALTAAPSAYLGARDLLHLAEADAWAGLPPLWVQREWLTMLHDLADADPGEGGGAFTRDDLDACGLFAGEAFAWSDHRVVIPWRDPSGTVQTLQRRRMAKAKGPPYVFPRGRKPTHPYGIDRLRPGVDVVLVEGAVDTLARRALDGLEGFDRDVLGLPGCEGWVADWGAYLTGRRVYIATDPDDAGERAAKRIAADAYQAGASEVHRMKPRSGSDWSEAWQSRQPA